MVVSDRKTVLQLLSQRQLIYIRVQLAELQNNYQRLIYFLLCIIYCSPSSRGYSIVWQ